VTPPREIEGNDRHGTVEFVTFTVAVSKEMGPMIVVTLIALMDSE
jgi:hypothetical protein